MCCLGDFFTDWDPMGFIIIKRTTIWENNLGIFSMHQTKENPRKWYNPKNPWTLGFEPVFRRDVWVLKIATGLRGQDS